MTANSPDNLRAQRLRVLKNQVRRLDGRLERLYRRSGRYAQIRLVVFTLGAVLSGAAFFSAGGWVLGVASLIIWGGAFGTAVYLHDHLEQGIIKYQIWRQLKAAQIARMELDWERLPPAALGRPPASHPFARDLDLTGGRSLHRLIDNCVSQEGSQRLRDWLCEPTPDLDQIQRRQGLVRLLTPLFLFRHKLSLYGLLATTGTGGWWQGDRLQEWLNERGSGQSLRLVLILAAILAPLNIILFTLYALNRLPAYWILSLILYAGLSVLMWRETATLFNQALTLQSGLKKVEGVFSHLERYPLERYPPLNALCQPFLDRNRRPSLQLRRVSRLVMAAGLVQNPAIALLLNLLMPWNLYFAYRLHWVKADLAQYLPQWLDIWFELEALSALAGYAYLNPGYAFPDIIPGLQGESEEGQNLFTAEALGHPLLPFEERICNDFTVTGSGEISLITGSNMAGKSSFLRTLGVNLRLAYAGGPVNAQRCRTICFRIFSSLNVSDSVTDGISYFYAEVKRLKALLIELERDDPLPLFYLIDEIFRGTNNRERYIGSRSYIRALVGQNGVGLIATHDLELVKLADELPQIKNYHFRETVVDGRMVFDYRLYPGPCPTTNALKIMQLEGLPVEQGQG